MSVSTATNPRRAVRHVLMTADCVGGVWTYAMELAAALDACDVRVTLAVMGPGPSRAQCEAAARLGRVTLVARPYRLEWQPTPWSDLEAAREWLLDLEAIVQPDVVHLNGYALAAAPWQAPVVVVGHSCVLSWWRAVHQAAAPDAWRRYEQAVRHGLQAADIVVIPTAAMRACLETHYGPLPRSVVIFNGRQVRTGAVPPKAPAVFTAGRIWDEAKNVRAVCDAAAAITWPVYVAGSSTAPHGRTAPVPVPVGAPLASPVTHLGPLAADEMAVWLARASIFALPALYEPFGLCPLEAALAGCALVLGDIESLREVWGDTALYVPPRDSPALARTIQSLIDDPAERARRAGCARRRALTMTPARMAAAYVAAYEQICAPPPDTRKPRDVLIGEPT